MPKHIGIVACSAEGAALCYTTICVEGAQILGRRYAHPEVTLHSLPFDEYMVSIDAGDWDAVARMMLRSAVKLAQAGAEFLISPDNTIHEAFSHVIEGSPLPWLHIAEEVAAEAVRRNHKRLGILGTRYLMEGPVYPDALDAESVEYRTPGATARERINQIIFDELVNGRLIDTSREYFVSVIEGLKDEGCDAVVLGCTEIPLLVTPADSPLPTLDSTRLLARAALRAAIGQRAAGL